MFEKGGSSVFLKNNKALLAFMCSRVATEFLSILNPTMHYQVGDIASLPVPRRLLSDKGVEGS